MTSHRRAETVLVLTAHGDLTADAVIGELNRRGADVARMDTGDFPIRSRLAATISATGMEGRLHANDVEVDLAAVRSIYYRRPTRFTFPDALSDADRVLAATEARLGLGGVLGALDALWINHPARVSVAEYKPIQLHLATRCGLNTPRTIITNDKAVAIEFAEAVGGPVVCKMLSSLALSEQGVPHLTYTTPIDARTIDSTALATTAHLIQEWVPKKYDARVTMVGLQAFAVARVTAAAARFLRRLGLTFGAFDFVVTTDGEWVMLEFNPAG